MITKFPPWIWPASWVLTFCAGIINAVGLLGFEHQAVTHLTGTTTYLGSALASGNGALIQSLLAALAAFVAGTALSGLLLPREPLRLSWTHGVVVALAAVFLGGAVPLLEKPSSFGYLMAAFACGLQNGMATIFSGALIRTSHVSGMFTDVGISLGHCLRGIPVDRRRMKLCLTVISAFLTGGTVGALLFGSSGYTILFLPAGILAVTAISFWSVQFRNL